MLIGNLRVLIKISGGGKEKMVRGVHKTALGEEGACPPHRERPGELLPTE